MVTKHPQSLTSLGNNDVISTYKSSAADREQSLSLSELLTGGSYWPINLGTLLSTESISKRLVTGMFKNLLTCSSR